MTATDVRAAAPEDTTGPGRGRAPRGPRTTASISIAGREPRVDLLPPEVHTERRERAIARRAWLGVIVAAAVAALGSGGAYVHQLDTAQSYLSAQNETTSLLQQQQRYSEVRSAENDTALLEAAQSVGGSTEIDWSSTLAQLKSVLPAGVSITAMTIDSADSTESFAQSTVPLQGSRAATMQLTIQSPSIPSVPDWTARLSQLRGYVDSTITSVALEEDTGQYSATIQAHLGAKAFDGKYTKDGSK
ncbi:hypothetical protein [Curtobacterium sp. USHLN213]|uniref:hypothetical protein n=1 Tax=Curtobacterium sp. USHLN213 TaxID=3081255 RepID=UPI003017DC12